MYILLLHLIVFLIHSPNGKEFTNHAFYLSVIEIEHAENGDSADIRIKVFSDDLQDALRNASPGKQVTSIDKLCTLESSVSQYFSDHLKVLINSEQVSIQQTKCCQESDVHWVTFIAPCHGKWTEIEVHADFFMELFPEQLHVIQIKYRDRKHFLKLDRKNPKKAIRF